jgi:hypothetical protein
MPKYLKKIHPIDRTKLPVMLVAAVFLAAGPASSSMVSNGAPNVNGASAVLSSQVFAESFTLSNTTTIQAAEFYTIEFPSGWDGTLTRLRLRPTSM